MACLVTALQSEVMGTVTRSKRQGLKGVQVGMVVLALACKKDPDVPKENMTKSFTQCMQPAQ